MKTLIFVFLGLFITPALHSQETSNGESADLIENALNRLNQILELTAEQSTQVREILTKQTHLITDYRKDMRTEMKGLLPEHSAERQQKRKEMKSTLNTSVNQMRLEGMESIYKLLTTEQQEKFSPIIDRFKKRNGL